MQPFDLLATSTLKAKLEQGAFSHVFSALYHNDPRLRFAALTDGFISHFGAADVALFSAPGRTELGGNHTDHQHGLVLTAAIENDIVACAAPTSTSVIRVVSEGYPPDAVELSALSANEQEQGTSAALIRGVCRGFVERGFSVGGLDVYTSSHIPRGGGLSSSAAFEILIGTILNTFYNSNAVSASVLASIAQFAENVYFGKPCGLLDQTAAATGGLLFVDFADPTSPVTERLHFDFSTTDYTVYIVQTGGDHTDLTADYAEITQDLAAVSACLGVSVLRDADRTAFEQNKAAIASRVGVRAANRATHVFEENARVLAQRAALQNGDFAAFLQLVAASGHSSRTLLQNVVSARHPERTALADALDFCQKQYGGRVVARVHGGGFAGAIQCYVPRALVPDFVGEMSTRYGEKSITPLYLRTVGGVEIREV